MNNKLETGRRGRSTVQATQPEASKRRHETFWCRKRPFRSMFEQAAESLSISDWRYGATEHYLCLAERVCRNGLEAGRRRSRVMLTRLGEYDPAEGVHMSQSTHRHPQQPKGRCSSEARQMSRGCLRATPISGMCETVDPMRHPRKGGHKAG